MINHDTRNNGIVFMITIMYLRDKHANLNGYNSHNIRKINNNINNNIHVRTKKFASIKT